MYIIVNRNLHIQYFAIVRTSVYTMQMLKDVLKHVKGVLEFYCSIHKLVLFLQKFFRLTNLRKLTLSENDLMRIPPNVANLTKLTELDISKNGMSFVCTQYLSSFKQPCTLLVLCMQVHFKTYGLYIPFLYSNISLLDVSIG